MENPQKRMMKLLLQIFAALTIFGAVAGDYCDSEEADSGEKSVVILCSLSIFEGRPEFAFFDLSTSESEAQIGNPNYTFPYIFRKFLYVIQIINFEDSTSRDF